MVFVLESIWIEVLGQLLDKPARHLDLAVLNTRTLAELIELRIAYLLRPVHGLHHDVAVRDPERA